MENNPIAWPAQEMERVMKVAEIYDYRKKQPSPKRMPVATLGQVLQLYQEKYHDCNVRHFHE